jgi:Type II secretion system (T2SS), protein E, N-terminal domain
VSSSEHDFQHVPQTRDGAPNWAADTDPVGPVTPELALVDPALAGGGQFNSEVTMSSMQFGDGTTLGSAEAPASSAEVQPIAPLQPIPPLNQVAPPAEVAAPVQADAAPAVPVTDMRDVPLGTLVFRAGLLPEERLEEALHEGMKTGRRLGEILLERGWVSENDLGRLLAGQKGLPFVELDPAAIDPTAPPLLHPEKARLHGALPVGFQDGVPVVAVADPSNDLVVENIRRALACEPMLVVAGRDALLRTIEQVYSGGVESTPAPGVAAPAAEVTAPVAPAPVAEPVATVETPAPVVDPVLPEPVAAAPEPVAAEPEVPATEPVAEVQPVAPLVVEPVAVEEPVAPLVAEPVAQVEPVAPPVTEQSAQPVDSEVLQNGHGLWVGETATEAAPEPVEAVQPLAQPDPVTPTEPEPVAAAPAVEQELQQEPEPSLACRVVLRLSDGERIEVGTYASEAEAVEGARGVIAQMAADGTSWPFFAGRFLRPDTIVSVDLEQEDADRWLGSSARAAAWTQKPAG